MKAKHDVVIVGAGPSGLFAAKRLAESGLEVLVLERKPTVGQAVNCTGIIGREIFKRFSLPLGSRLRDVHELRMVSPSGLSLAYRHPEPFATIVDRSKFDQELAGQAKAQGVSIRTGLEVEEIATDASGAKVLARGPRGDAAVLNARMAVVATGVNLGLHRKLGLGLPGSRLFGAQVEAGQNGISLPTVFTGTDIAPGGFAWAVPSADGKVKYGLITEQNPRKSFARFAAKYLSGRMSPSDLEGVQYKSIAQGFASRIFSPAVISLGEAAGQVKTTTGGGIGYGVHCAEIASEVIAGLLKAGRPAAGGLEDYERRCRKALHREIRVGLIARKIWSQLSDAQIEKIFRITQDDGIIPLIQERGNFDWQSDLILALMRKASLFKIMSGVGKAFLPSKMSLS
jgi:digeranylgeranylglycerophospholipid reductase